MVKGVSYPGAIMCPLTANSGHTGSVRNDGFERVGARNPVVAGQAALRNSLTSPSQRVARMIRVGARNSVVGADQGFRAPS